MIDVVPAAPVPAAGSPAAKASSATPAPAKAAVSTTAPPAPATTTATPPPESAELKAERQKLADERRAIQVKMVRQKNAHAEEMKAKDKTWGEKLSKLSEYEKWEQQAKLNPAALERLYGEKWYDKIVEAKVSGAPPADMIASEIAKVREELEAKFSARDEARTKSEAAARQSQDAQVRRELHAEGMQFVKTSGADFPALGDLGPPDRVAALLTQRMEQKYNSTVEKDESGAIVTHGQVMTMREAAEELETEILAITEKAVKHAKYASRFTPSKSPAAVIGGPVLQQPSQQRRTLSNELTASTSRRTPPANENDRRERAIAAFNSMRSKGTQ